MNIKKTCLSLIAIILLFSCAENNGIVNEVTLKGQIVNITSNEGKIPVFLIDDYVYSRDSAHNVWVGKLSKNEWQKSEMVFAFGHGHNEFGIIAPSKGEDGTLYILNHPMVGGNFVSLTKIPHANNITSMKDQTKWETHNLINLPAFSQAGQASIILPDSTILVTGAPSNDLKHIFSIINYKKLTVTPLDYWPDDGNPDKLQKDKFLIYSGYGHIEKNGNGKFLYWNEVGKHAFIFSIEGTKISIQNKLYADRLHLPSVDGHPSCEQISCCSDKDRIYVLYKEYDRKGEKLKKIPVTDPFVLGNTIEVYDWDGVKQQVIHLDKLGDYILLSEDGNTLYLFPSDWDATPFPLFYSYNLRTIE